MNNEKKETEFEKKLRENTENNNANLDLLIANTYTSAAKMRKDEYLRTLGLDPKKYKNVPELQLLRTLIFNAKVEKAKAQIELNTRAGLFITHLRMIQAQQEEKENEKDN